MPLYCIKRLMFTKNRNIKIKCKIDEKFYLYSGCFDCGLKKFETIDEEDLSYLLKTMLLYCLKCRKNTKGKKTKGCKGKKRKNNGFMKLRGLW